MRWPVRSCLVLASLCFLHASARAQDAPGTDSAVVRDGVELGAHLGLTTGGRVSPGGMRIGGLLLYRLSSIDWFEGVLDFTAGSGSAACFRDRAGEYLCNHGALSGRSIEVGAGIRRFLMPSEAFTPFAHARVGVRLASFPGDDVRGIAIPLVAGAGVRARVHELLSVGGGAALEAGAGWFSRDLGWEPQVSLTVQAGVEFHLY